MASIEEGKIEEHTLALYSATRCIRHYNSKCQHWYGEMVPNSGVSYLFATEGAALKWFRNGTVVEGTRTVTAQELADGCACRRAAMADASRVLAGV